jgi:hypothetical protein
MLVARLAQSLDPAARDAVVQQLIDLGPRYLAFFRKIDDEAVLVDLLLVMHRIETANAPAEVKDDAPQPVHNGGEEPKPPEQPTGPYDREQVERFYSSILKQAQTHLDAGRYDRAARMAESAIVLMPDSKWRPDFDAVILKARNEGQADLLIAGSMTLEPEYAQYAEAKAGSTFAQPVQIRCFLQNVSLREITLRINEGEGRESVLQLVIRYEQTDYQATTMSQQDNVNLRVDAGGSVTLAPGAKYELTVPLAGLSSLDQAAPLKNALGRAQIDASLRVYGAHDADGRPIFLKPVRFSRQAIYVFPATFDLAAAKEKPLTLLRDMIAKQRAQEVFFCAHVIDDRQHRNAGDILVADDFAECPLAVQRARLRAMQVLFNAGATWDIRQWRKWWDENRLLH